MAISTSPPPSPVPPAVDAGKRLDSWKEIAAYLNRDVRTVERWAAHKGLPVHRVSGTHRQSVFAFTRELDAWLVPPVAADSAPGMPGMPGTLGAPARSRSRVFVIGSATLAGAAVLMAGLWLLAVARPAGSAVALRQEGRDIVALDAEKREAWRYQVAARPVGLWTSLKNQAQRHHALIGVAVDLQAGGLDVGQLLGLSPQGQLLWKHVVQDEWRYAAGTYGPPWGGNDTVLFHVDGQPRIASAFHHHTWWPSVLTVLDRQGQPIDRFVNAGWITAVGLSTDQQFLLAAGMNQEHDATMLAVLDVRHPGGSSPTERESPFTCENCPPGAPVRYFVLPHPELRKFGDRGIIVPTLRSLASGEVQLRVPPGVGTLPGAEVIFDFSRDLELRSATASSPYWEWHRRAESRGELNHPAERCPERQGFDVKEWTPASGWRTIRVPSLTAGAAR